MARTLFMQIDDIMTSTKLANQGDKTKRVIAGASSNEGEAQPSTDLTNSRDMQCRNSETEAQDHLDI